METPKIIIDYSNTADETDISDIKDVTKGSNLEIEFVRRNSSEVYAAIEWLVPTLIVCIVGKSFFEEIGKIAANELFELIKNVARHVAKKDIENPIKLYNKDGYLENLFSNAMSVRYNLPSLPTVVLRFHKNSTQSEIEESIFLFFQLANEHFLEREKSRLSMAIKRLPIQQNWPNIVYLERKRNALHLVDILQSGASGEIVSVSI
jgi:hypothetical protein